MSATVTDEQIRQLAAMAKPYSLALLVGSERGSHGDRLFRRNQAEPLLPTIR